jgi:WD40 repeat protein
LLTYQRHTNEVTAISWSPDGRYIASGSWDHTVQVWNAKTGQPLVIYRGHSDNVDALAWSPDGRLIASGSWDRTVQVWQAAQTG